MPSSDLHRARCRRIADDVSRTSIAVAAAAGLDDSLLCMPTYIMLFQEDLLTMTGARERMVESAVKLIRELGAQPTAMADVIRHSGAPRGSAYHYFPGGRTQLMCEAVDYAAEYVALKLSEGQSGIEVLDALVNQYREQLRRSDYRAGCPIVAVTVEAGSADRTTPVIERAARAFTHWTDLLTTRLIADGFARSRAADLAMLITSALEGAIVVCRAVRGLEPLEMVHRQLRDLLSEPDPGRMGHVDQ